MRTVEKVLLGVLIGGVSACGGAPPPETGEVIDKLKAGGVPIKKVVTYTEDSDPNKLLGRPAQYVGKANFRLRGIEGPNSSDSDIDTSEGGSVEVFASESEAVERLNYVEAIAKSGGLFAEYDYREGQVLLRISKDVAPSKARRYGEALAD